MEKTMKKMEKKKLKKKLENDEKSTYFSIKKLSIFILFQRNQMRERERWKNQSRNGSLVLIIMLFGWNNLFSAIFFSLLPLDSTNRPVCRLFEEATWKLKLLIDINRIIATAIISSSLICIEHFFSFSSLFLSLVVFVNFEHFSAFLFSSLFNC